MFFSYANFQHSRKHNCYMKSIDKRFITNVFEAVQKIRNTCFIKCLNHPASPCDFK